MCHPAGVAAGAPSGVVTFLFTDIEGSTRRWEADAAEMRAALAAHDDVLRVAIEAYGGWLFKHTGDGVCAAFASPRAAVDAAVAAQLALELPVRMGIATGEAELRGQDYFGVALNRAARVMAAGHGGQILLADSTAVLLNDVDLIDLGPRRLRDVPAPVGLFQVGAEGLATEFPPLRTLDTSPGNLRPHGTSFIGRESEVESVHAALRDHRLVTLTGVGGVGKTRLAVEVARRSADQFPDGAWVLELAAVSDPTAVPDAVASTLGITQQAGASLADSVAAAQDGRVRLLVFDNCEHLLDAAAELIETILAHSSTVKILATSREGLGTTDEKLWTVPSLDVSAAAGSAAVALFADRASNVAQRFSMSEGDTATEVVEICRRLDGIPLAIELAASRMASMTAGEVRERLDHRFRLLVGSRRGMERHQTLRHAVQWSYDLLSESERNLLDRCSVFSGGFDLQSACAVVGTDEYTVLDLLDALVRKSLLVADRASGRTRYSMLETIRQFAEEQLVAKGDADSARAAHARHFAECETDLLVMWDSPDQRQAYEWFTVELANLRTAFRWAADHGHLDVAAVIATYAPFLGYGIEGYEPVAWAEELIEPARIADHRRLASLYAMAALCWMPGRIEEAVTYSEAGEVLIESGRYEVPFGADGWLGTAYLNIGQPQRWVRWCRRRLEHGSDPHTLIRMWLVLALMMAGRPDDALAAADGLIDAAEATRNPYAISFALFAHGFALRDADPAQAIEDMRKGLVIARNSGNRFSQSNLAISLASLEAQHGDPLVALDNVTLAIRSLHDSGNVTTMRSPLAILAAFLDRLGRYEAAATIAGFGNSPLTSAGYPEITVAIAHLRTILGDERCETLSRTGEAMTPAAIAAYAYDQIDLARAEVSGHA
ncbi:MAG: hypothetical protein QOH27_5480 [Mycobacterium sp.]|nr:hypothetical protein [Mycobacterium sp.]